MVEWSKKLLTNPRKQFLEHMHCHVVPSIPQLTELRRIVCYSSHCPWKQNRRKIYF